MADGGALFGRTAHVLADANALLARAASECNLVAPARDIGELPEGTGLALSCVQVSTHVDVYGFGRDVYIVDGGELALRAHVLNQIAAVVGVSWDAKLSYQVDDASERYLWRYKAVGSYLNFGLERVTVQDEYELDLRDGSPRFGELFAPSKRLRMLSEQKAARELAEQTLQRLRKHGLRNAVTGARSAAIASIGVKRAWSVDELQRPFAVAKLLPTGRSSSPSTRRALALRALDALQGASGLLYGGQARAEGGQIRPPSEDGPRKVTAQGKTLTLAEWAKITGVSAKTIRRRIDELGWHPERAVAEKSRRAV